MILTVCETCKRPDYDPESGAERDGSKLAALIEALPENENVNIRRHACLMGCKFACNVALQAPGKLTYSLGTFEPTEEAAAGIVELAKLYEASETGKVAFADWPEAIKGHFRARIPPLPEEMG